MATSFSSPGNERPSSTSTSLGTVHVDYQTANVLEDQELREGIKAYTNWPTIPQLYVKGEFVGGSDIMMEMFEAGELQTLFSDQGVPTTAG